MNLDFGYTFGFNTHYDERQRKPQRKFFCHLHVISLLTLSSIAIEGE